VFFKIYCKESMYSMFEDTLVPLTQRFSNFFKWGPLSLVRMFYGPPYSWDYQTH